LQGCGWDGKTALTAAGKNFASFDRQFLKRLPRFEQVVRLRHRTLDPAVLYWHPLEDEELPSSKTCYERAGLDNKVAHTAVEDALAVVRLVRLGIKRLRGMQPCSTD
jgi:DNA polymerase III epsilon subunit-like protein